MNTALHQLKWDFRRTFVVWLVWLLLLTGTAWLHHFELSNWSRKSPWPEVALLLRVLVIYLGGAALTCWLTQTTPFRGSEVHWRTRPISQRSLFWQKTFAILGLVLLPALAATLIPLWLFLPDAGFVLETGALPVAFVIGCVVLSALWGALSSRPSLLVACAAATLVIFYVSAFLASQLLSDHFVIRLAVDARFASMGWLVGGLSVILVAAWVLQARFRLTSAAVGVAVLGLVTTSGLTPLIRTNPTPTLTPLPRIDLDLQVREQGDDLPPELTPLFPQLAARIPEDEILVLGKLTTRLENPDNPSRDDHRQQFFTHHFSEACLASQLARFFPARAGLTSLRGEGEARLDTFSFPGNNPAEATFSGSYTGSLCTSRRLAAFPVAEDASVRLGNLGRARIAELATENDSITARLTIVARGSDTGPGAIDRELRDHRNSFFFIAHHPHSNELLVPRRSGYSGHLGGNRLNRATLELDFERAKLARVLGKSPSPADLAELDLHVFSLTPRASCSGTFRQENWHPFEEHPLPGQRTIEAPAWTEAELPADPGREEVEAYLDKLLYGLPDNRSNRDWREIRERFDALGPEHLNLLLTRLPAPSQTRALVNQYLTEHADARHLPSLLATLPRDPGIAGVMRQKGWEGEAAPVLVELLKERTPTTLRFSGSIVPIVAGLHDPDSYPDLAWHFIHADRDHFEMAEALAACPGFPLAKCIRDGWALARTGVSQQSHADLMLLAARQGDRDALRRTIAAFHEQPRGRTVDRLAKALRPPEGSDPVAWAHRHFEELRYDETLGAWVRDPS